MTSCLQHAQSSGNCTEASRIMLIDIKMGKLSDRKKKFEGAEHTLKTDIIILHTPSRVYMGSGIFIRQIIQGLLLKREAGTSFRNGRCVMNHVLRIATL